MRPLLIVTAFLLLLFRTSMAQDVVAGQLFRPDLNALSPQTYDFVRSGNVPVSYFTGETSVRIPIYTYSDKDFEIPVYLGYNSSGFNPNKREGVVGLNWYLSAGGAITRRVRGVPDEEEGLVTVLNEHQSHGLYFGIKSNMGVKNANKDAIFQFQSGTGTISSLFWEIDDCEVDPDEFTFNMPGHNGTFFIENNGVVRCSGNKPFKVDLTGFSLQSYNSSEVFNSEIKVKTDDGYIYSFGGTKEFLEISYQLHVGQSNDASIDVAQIVAWHLTKIEAPNGRTVLFQYESFSEGFDADNRIPNDTRHYLGTMYNSQYLIADNYCHDFTSVYGTELVCEDSGSDGQVLVKEVTKTTYLKKIIVDNISIDFVNVPKARKFYPTTDLGSFNQFNLQLNEIKVLPAGVATPLHHFKLKYEDHGGTTPRQFLTSLAETGAGTYDFEYHRTNPLLASPLALPNPLSNGVDHWGFWNGGNSTTSKLIPNTSYTANGDVFYTSTERDPSPTHADVGLLAKVSYPTGGHTLFEYEAHQYKRRLERRSAGNFLPELLTMSVTPNAGGARIKSIVDHDGTKITGTREFKYVSDFTTGGQESSGILMNWPRYMYYWKYYNPNGNITQHYLRLNSTSFHSNHYPGEGHIQYSEVTEVVSPANGCTTYKFTSYLDHPDENNYDTEVVATDYVQHVTNVHLYNNFIGIKFNDRSFARGQPREVTTYATKTSGGYYEISKKTVDFTSLADNTGHYAVGAHQTGGIVQSFKLYYYPFLPKKETNVTYSNEGAQSSTVVADITYNATTYIATNTIKGSEGITRSTKYKYSSDFVTDADAALMFNGAAPTATYTSLTGHIKALVDLKLNNILNKPVEVIQYYNNQAIAATFVQYKDFTCDVACQEKSKQVYPHLNWVVKTSEAISSFDESSFDKTVTPWTYTKNDAYGTLHVTSYDKFDDKGNLLEMTDKERRKTSYLWGYGQLYPVAEFVGAKNSDVFYQGFEDTESSATTICNTGVKCRTGAYTRTLNGITPGNYTLTYWRKLLSSSAWELKKDPIVISGTSYSISLPSAYRIDDVRLYPSTPVLVNTFNYQLGRGMVSKTDTNNKAETYTYDGVGRLRLIKDFASNIVKMFEYNYKIK